MTDQMRPMRSRTSSCGQSAHSFSSMSFQMGRCLRSACSSISARVRERMRDGQGGDASAGRGLAFFDDEPAADRVINAAREQIASAIEGGKPHPVGMAGQDLVDMEEKIARLVERDAAACRRIRSSFVLRMVFRSESICAGIDFFGLFAGEPEKNGLIRAVTYAGERERSVKFGKHARYVGQDSFAVRVRRRICGRRAWDRPYASSTARYRS